MFYSRTPTDIGNAALGSQQDGEYVKLPSYSEMGSQIEGYQIITMQVRFLHRIHLTPCRHLTERFFLSDVNILDKSLPV